LLECLASSVITAREKRVTGIQGFSGLMDAPVSRGMTLFLRVNESAEILIRLPRE